MATQGASKACLFVKNMMLALQDVWRTCLVHMRVLNHPVHNNGFLYGLLQELSSLPAE